MDGGAAFDAIPAAIPTPREVGLFFLLGSLRGIIDGQGVQIQEAGAARVALLRDLHADAARLGFVGEELQEPRMGNLHEFLIVLLPQFHVGFPERVLAQDQHANAFLHRAAR